MFDQQQKHFWLLLNIFIAVLILTLAFVIAPAIKNNSDSRYPASTLSVSAEGKTVEIPDVATFTFSVTLEGANPKEIADEVNKRADGAITFLKSEDISSDDIRTTEYTLTPKYNYDRFSGQSNIYAYELTQTTQVKIRDFDKIAIVISGLTELGINRVGSLSFTIDDPEEFMKKAREEAFKKAKEKAQNIAGSTGIRLGKIINVSDYQNTPYSEYYAKDVGLGGFGGEAVPVAPPQIEPGTQEITVTVNLTYEIR